MIDSHAKSWWWAPARTAARPVAIPVAIALFALLTAVGAYVAVPLGITPVPMTLQTLFVLLAGLILGPVAGAASQLLYLGLGVAGVPVFAMGAAGLPWILGPTGGYLMAFPVCAAVVGGISGSQGRPWRMVVALVVGSGIIFVMGAAGLMVFSDLSSRGLFAAAVQPFLIGAAIKAAIAFVAARGIAPTLRGRGR